MTDLEVEDKLSDLTVEDMLSDLAVEHELTDLEVEDTDRTGTMMDYVDMDMVKKTDMQMMGEDRLSVGGDRQWMEELSRPRLDSYEMQMLLVEQRKHKVGLKERNWHSASAVK